MWPWKYPEYIRKLESIVEGFEPDQTRKDERIKYLEAKLAIANQEKATLELEKERNKQKELTGTIDISDPIFQEMIKAGRNSMVKKAHPDHGGGS